MSAYKPSKKVRRRVIASALVFCAVMIAYIIYEGGDDQTRVAALYSMSAFASSIVWFYINGSTKDAASYNETLIALKGE